jgi:hypothetical protein
MATVKLDVEDRVLDRIRKLLRLASDARGNEHEAALAARRAGELMEQHGLSTAVIEAAGGVGEGRVSKDAESFERGRAPWMAELMRAVAEASFCLCEVEHIGSGKKQRMTFRLFGRESAVAGAFALADYLKQTIWRLSGAPGVERPHYFRSGCAERLGERVREGHAAALAEQRAEAERAQRESAARAKHPGAWHTSTALTVILADAAAAAAAANEELRRGLPPGTLAAERAAAAAERAARERDYQKLIADGIEQGVAWNMVFMNMTHARAVEYEAEWQVRNSVREESEQTRRRRTRREEREREASFRRYLREQERKSDPSWVAGREKGDEVSLARQLSEDRGRRLK